MSTFPFSQHRHEETLEALANVPPDHPLRAEFLLHQGVIRLNLREKEHEEALRIFGEVEQQARASERPQLEQIARTLQVQALLRGKFSQSAFELAETLDQDLLPKSLWGELQVALKTRRQKTKKN